MPPAESVPTPAGLGIRPLSKKFQGDKASEFGVFSFVDHTHPAAAQLIEDAVVRNGLADHV